MSDVRPQIDFAWVVRNIIILNEFDCYLFIIFFFYFSIIKQTLLCCSSCINFCFGHHLPSSTAHMSKRRTTARETGIKRSLTSVWHWTQLILYTRWIDKECTTDVRTESTLLAWPMCHEMWTSTYWKRSKQMGRWGNPNWKLHRPCEVMMEK